MVPGPQTVNIHVPSLSIYLFILFILIGLFSFFRVIILFGYHYRSRWVMVIISNEEPKTQRVSRIHTQLSLCASSEAMPLSSPLFLFSLFLLLHCLQFPYCSDNRNIFGINHVGMFYFDLSIKVNSSKAA